MSQEVISGKTFVEEGYPIHDIGGGVISKGQAIRHYEKMHPEHTVVSISSFKIDHQDETISVRVQVKPKPVVLPDDNQKSVEPVALLNPGYDELLAENAKLKKQLKELSKAYEEVEVKLLELGARKNHVEAEDAADLAEAKEVLKRSQSVPPSEFYDGLTGSEDDPGE